MIETELSFVETTLLGMQRRLDGPGASFPPTELYSEGWMLRLLMELSAAGSIDALGSWTNRTHWFSEARLASSFAPRWRKDPIGEGATHADGIIGDFGPVRDRRPACRRPVPRRANHLRRVITEVDEAGTRLALMPRYRSAPRARSNTPGALSASPRPKRRG